MDLELSSLVLVVVDPGPALFELTFWEAAVGRAAWLRDTGRERGGVLLAVGTGGRRGRPISTLIGEGLYLSIKHYRNGIKQPFFISK